MKFQNKKTCQISDKWMKENTIPLDEMIASLPIEEQKAIEAQTSFWESVFAVKKERKAAKLTQQQLAEKSGIPRTTISKIESGYRNTTVAMLDRIAEAMNKKLVISFQ